MSYRQSLLIPFLLSEGVRGVLVSTADAHRHPLSVEEGKIIEGAASELYRLQFRLGRVAAKEALRELRYFSATQILRDGNGAPIWPANFVGSIAHTAARPTNALIMEAYGVALVAQREIYKGVGVDVEFRDRQVSEGLAEKVCTEEELRWVFAGTEGWSSRLVSTIAAKEAVYKALFPLVRRYFGFHSARVTFDREVSTFRVELLEGLSADFVEGFTLSGTLQGDRGSKDRPLVIASILVPQSA